MKAWLHRLAFTALLLLGLSQLAQGGWIYIKAELAQQLMRAAWQDTLATGQAQRPWPWADTWPVARLLMPRLDVDVLVLAGYHGQALAFGPGHASASAALGKPGISLISGHRDTHFRFIRSIHIGDLVKLVALDGSELDYQVIETRIVNTDYFSFESGSAPGLILSTCWPFDAIRPGGPLRYLVVAELTDDFLISSAGKETETGVESSTPGLTVKVNPG